jgi:hypothetical protein
VRVARGTETGEAPGWQGAKRESIGHKRAMSNAASPGAPRRARLRAGVEEGCIARRMQQDFHHGS